LSVAEMIALAQHGVDAEWVAAMQWLGYELACGQEQESFNSILLNAPPPWLSFPLARA
jgi:hypothetical protein